MEFVKRVYENGKTVISAENLNDIQDALIYCLGQLGGAGSGGTVTANTVKVASVLLTASAWTGSGSLYSQIVTVDGVTPYSKVDLQLSPEQLAIFHDKDLALVAENEDGVVTVYAIGDKPANDYTIQATITEVGV